MSVRCSDSLKYWKETRWLAFVPVFGVQERAREEMAAGS